MARNRPERGYTLITVAVLLVVLVGMVGIVVDLGRMYIIKNELQSFVDAAAVAAALELDGTADGLARAGSAAASGPSGSNGPNKWNFSSQTLSGVQVEYSQSAGGAWVASPGSAGGYRMIRVRVVVDVPLYFIAVIQGTPKSISMSASASAGQLNVVSAGEGLAPFSPDAINPADPDFGFQKGGALLYTLKWAPPGIRKLPGGNCSGHAGSPVLESAQDRGYIDVGQGDGNDGLIAAIVNSDFFLPQPLITGGPVTMVVGNKFVGPALRTRFYQDQDTTSVTYADYRAAVHNGRRIVSVPVNHNGTVLGFAAFLLPPAMSCWNDNRAPCCGEYIGPAVLNSRHTGGSVNSGAYLVRLFQ